MIELPTNKQSCIKVIAQYTIVTTSYVKMNTESQAKRLLDAYSDSLNTSFTTLEEVWTITGCDELPWWSGCMHLSHGINDYIKSLNLSSGRTNTFASIINKPNYQPPTKQRRIILTTGKFTRLPKGSDWDNLSSHLKREKIYNFFI